MFPKAIARHLAAPLHAAVILLVPVAAQAQDADEGGEDVLVLDYACGNKYADTPSLAKCLQRQNEKADRWLQAAVESYARWAANEMETQRRYGGHPVDQIAQLRESHAAFETYREESAELVRQSIDGSIAGFESAKAYFHLTVDRAGFLLHTCYSRFNSKLADKVDLTITDWCPLTQ